MFEVHTASLIDTNLTQALQRVRDLKDRLPELFEKAMTVLPRFNRVAVQLCLDETLSSDEVKLWMVRSVRQQCGCGESRDKPSEIESTWAEITLVTSIDILQSRITLLASSESERQALKHIRSIIESTPEDES